MSALAELFDLLLSPLPTFSSCRLSSQVFFSASCSSFLLPHPNREGIEDLLEIVVCFIRIFFKALVFVYTWGWIGDFVNMWVVINHLKGKGAISPERKKKTLNYVQVFGSCNFAAFLNSSASEIWTKSLPSHSPRSFKGKYLRRGRFFAVFGEGGELYGLGASLPPTHIWMWTVDLLFSPHCLESAWITLQ